MIHFNMPSVGIYIRRRDCKFYPGMLEHIPLYLARSMPQNTTDSYLDCDLGLSTAKNLITNKQMTDLIPSF